MIDEEMFAFDYELRLIDLLMPFVHPPGFPSMSRLGSPFYSR
jgi:hypothetical protein